MRKIFEDTWMWLFKCNKKTPTYCLYISILGSRVYPSVNDKKPVLSLVIGQSHQTIIELNPLFFMINKLLIA